MSVPGEPAEQAAPPPPMNHCSASVRRKGHTEAVLL